MTNTNSLTDWGMIQQQPDLEAFCKSVDDAPYLALDTEFHRESTYTAKLALIQIASDQHLGCIDPLADLCLDPLIRLLESTKPKLLHSIHQDAEVLSTAIGARLNTVFDTQIAAAFCNHPAQLSYRDAVEQATGTLIDKGESRSDWMRRPLRDRQLDYAKVDVIYLAQIKAHYLSQLNPQLQAWVWEESQRQADDATDLLNESVILGRIKLRFPLPPETCQRLAVLHFWREQQALNEDKPRRWILSDSGLREIAELSDTNIDAIANIISQDKRSDPTIAHAIHEVLLHETEKETRTFEEINPIEDPEIKGRIKTLVATCQKIASDHNISPTLVASRKMITAYVLQQPSLLTQGWRYELLKDHL